MVPFASGGETYLKTVGEINPISVFWKYWFLGCSRVIMDGVIFGAQLLVASWFLSGGAQDFDRFLNGKALAVGGRAWS